jgi:hypothetical protein
MIFSVKDHVRLDRGVSAGPQRPVPDEGIRKLTSICKIDEIAIHVPDAARADDLLSIIKTRGIEVLAHCCVPAPQGALSLVVADQPQQAQTVLEQAGHACKARPVVLVRFPLQPAIAARLGMQLTAAQIGIYYCYVTWREAGQAHIVFKTTDDDHTIRVLQTWV